MAGLCITRYLKQKIVIPLDENNVITIQVLKSFKKGAKLLIDAPRHIPVHREEIYERVGNKLLPNKNGGTDNDEH